MRKRLTVCPGLLALALWAAGAAHAGVSYDFTTFDAPGAAHSTSAFGLDDAGETVGHFGDAALLAVVTAGSMGTAICIYSNEGPSMPRHMTDFCQCPIDSVVKWRPTNNRETEYTGVVKGHCHAYQDIYAVEGYKEHKARRVKAISDKPRVLVEKGGKWHSQDLDSLYI